jgi:hypothetical protein
MEIEQESNSAVAQLPFVAIITVRWIINQQLPDGQYHPKAVDSDSFSLKVFGKDEQECQEKLKAKIAKMKDSDNV